MSDQNTFTDFIRRIRSGDAEAAAELIRQYEPVIRLEVRMRLSDPRLRRVFDSMDICQSVLASFFLRAASGQYELDEPANLVRLLVVMARNKLAFQARKQRAQCRDNRRLEPINPVEYDAAAAGPSPSQVVAGEELLREFRQRLSNEERRLADLRAAGREWADIATEIGGTPQARRKQLERAVNRVSRELGLDETGEQ
jgi:RNA polymerase sigma-70 factor (ECF subfamily)